RGERVGRAREVAEPRAPQIGRLAQPAGGACPIGLERGSGREQIGERAPSRVVRGVTAKRVEERARERVERRSLLRKGAEVVRGQPRAVVRIALEQTGPALFGAAE